MKKKRWMKCGDGCAAHICRFRDIKKKSRHNSWNFLLFKIMREHCLELVLNAVNRIKE